MGGYCLSHIVRSLSSFIIGLSANEPAVCLIECRIKCRSVHKFSPRNERSVQNMAKKNRGPVTEVYNLIKLSYFTRSC